MPVFNVKIIRETVDEITVPIEAASRDAITEKCLPSFIYEGINHIKKIGDWRVVQNDIDVDDESVMETDEHAQLVLGSVDDKPTLKRAPKKPYVDPRQVKMFKEKTK